MKRIINLNENNASSELNELVHVMKYQSAALQIYHHDSLCREEKLKSIFSTK